MYILDFYVHTINTSVLLEGKHYGTFKIPTAKQVETRTDTGKVKQE